MATPALPLATHLPAASAPSVHGGHAGVGDPLEGAAAAEDTQEGGSVEKYKTKLCVFHNSVRGCPYGDKCLFAHGE